MSAKNLVIVESPAKAKTIEKYLGKDFAVLASYGHVRDLVPKEGAVDPDNGFAMRYEVTEKSEKHVNAISRALKKAEALYLATDPDREGEAISWHLHELLKEDKKALEGKAVYRVVFHEITKNAVNEAIANPRTLSADLIDAQQARRALDYLVGFNLSPLLWKKIRPGLSAGRVQSPALRMICEREDEIDAFRTQEYWTIEAESTKDGQPVPAKLAELDGKKLGQFDIGDEKRAHEVRQKLLAAAGRTLTVSKVEKKERKRNPAAPFTTSTLQQEASRKLGFGAQRTMRAAQQLYENGLITYMRTDSVTLAREAVADIRDTIRKRYGEKSLPSSPRMYKTKAKNAQEAHEAIRPTSAGQAPDTLTRLAPDPARLYDLIWKRTIACQMVPAIFDTVSVDLACGTGNRFRSSGSTLVEPGFIAVYIEGVDDANDDEAERSLPPLEQGDTLTLVDIKPEQHFTQPPPRYSEASLVKTLEEYGIGRPSTYASIISTLQQRDYVEMDKRRFIPTDIGRMVNRFLTQHFAQYVDYDFTARLEDELDAVARGEQEWVPVMEGFWTRFKELVDFKEENVSRDEVQQAREIGTDPESGKPMTVRMGRFGPFVQIGTRDDDEKPRFAGLRPGQKMDQITFDEAMKLFELPREIGETPEGEPLLIGIGRFGPFVKYGSKYASIKEDDPYEISRERALEIVAEKKLADANRLIREWPDEGIQVLNGRYGPYITDKERNARIPKDTEPTSLTLEQCKELLSKAPLRRGRGKKKAVAKKKVAKKKPAAKKKKKAAAKRKASKKKSSPKKD
ncbi:MAG: DNA topoisomerase I [Xanthomonadaceae bacterium]|nr:DNA topoisomerase I [Xanthomonadaceae bacterium]